MEDYYRFFRKDRGVGGGPGVGNAGGGYNYTVNLYLPQLSGSLCFIRLKVKNVGSSFEYAYCCSSGGNGEQQRIPAYMQGFWTVDIPVVRGASNYNLYLSSCLWADEIELWTVPKN